MGKLSQHTLGGTKHLSKKGSTKGKPKSNRRLSASHGSVVPTFIANAQAKREHMEATILSEKVVEGASAHFRSCHGDLNLNPRRRPR